MPSTTRIGNEFRETVVTLLEAAGMRSRTEVRVLFKKVDIVAEHQDQFDGQQLIGVEAKNITRNLTKEDCLEFVAEYGKLVSDGHLTRAWLISANEISSDGRMCVDSHKNLRCYTFAEFKRTIMSFDGYMEKIIAEYKSSGLEKYYVPPRCSDGSDLKNRILEWINSASTDPIVIVGGYGQGKSTFAKHLAEHLSKQAVKSKYSRIPILIPLGEIYDEQSVEGLISKICASSHRVIGYHFDLLIELNKRGHFIFIFDGFDEMKHGMTPAIFISNFNRLLSLNVGEAKLLFLGRDTVFHNDEEFRSVIEGKERTRGGQLVAIRGKVQCKTLTLAGFRADETRHFVKNFFPLVAAESLLSSSQSCGWISQRTDRLLDGSFDQLMERPVHAQMLCQIATDPDIDLDKISSFALYDRFIHFLLRRELEKAGRYQGFSADVRRRFNSSLAWWLWEREHASTSSLSKIPPQLYEEAIGGSRHPFSADALGRELIAGCLAVKGGEAVFFAHRSIQEFLVSEHLFENNLLKDTAPQALQRVLRALNPEIIAFLIGWVESRRDRDSLIEDWFDLLARTNTHQLPLRGFDLFVQLRKLGSARLNIREPWSTLVTYFSQVGSARFQLMDERLPWFKEDLKTRLTKFPSVNKSNWIDHEAKSVAALIFWSGSLLYEKNSHIRAEKCEYMIACLFCVPATAITVLELSKNSTKNAHFSFSSNFMQHILFSSIGRAVVEKEYISVNLELIQSLCTRKIEIGFRDQIHDEIASSSPRIRVSKLRDLISDLVDASYADAVCNFLTNSIVRRISVAS